MSGKETDWERIDALRELHDRIYNHDAKQMEHSLNSLWSSHYTLFRNYQEFMKAVEEYKVTGEKRLGKYHEGEADRNKIPKKYTPEEASELSFLTMSPTEDEEIFVFLRECTKRLNNYATSAYSLYENAQNFRKKWIKDDLEDCYYEKLDVLKIEKKNKLVEDIRRYTTHYKSIPLTIHDHQNYLEGTRDIHLILSREKLEDSGFLRAPSRDYIEEMDTEEIREGRIDIPWVIQQHKEAVNPFYNWLVEEMYESYSDEFDELEELEQEYDEMKSSE
jgi:hypothetical protein